MATKEQHSTFNSAAETAIYGSHGINFERVMLSGWIACEQGEGRGEKGEKEREKEKGSL